MTAEKSEKLPRKVATRLCFTSGRDRPSTSRYPELRFVSTAIQFDGETLVADGELTVKGVTRPVELRGTLAGPVEDAYGRERVGIELETAVDRTEFGLNWNAPLPGGGLMLADDVKLIARLWLVRQA